MGMSTSNNALTPETEALLIQHGGPLAIPGEHGDYVLMRTDVYQAMLGFGDDDEAETLAAVRRGIADLRAGRTFDLDEVFDELDRSP
jgi:hypothetical protein